MKSGGGRDEAARSRKFEVLVLGGRWLRERDKIVFLLARDYGRLDAVVYGARKEGGKWAGRLEPFVRLNAALYRGKSEGLWTMREAEVIGEARVETDWRIGVVLQAAAELIVHATPSEGTEPDSFALAESFAEELRFSPEPVTVLLAFVVAWIGKSGFGLPECEGEARLARFVSRSSSDPASCWRRYRLPIELRERALTLVRDHAENCIETKWRGMETLVKLLAK